MGYKYKLSEMSKKASAEDAEKELGIPKSKFEVGQVTISDDGQSKSTITNINDTTGAISWKIDQLPGFDKLYDEMDDLVGIAKRVYVKTKDDGKFREFYEDARKLRNSLRTHLRNEYPDQYKRITRIGEAAQEVDVELPNITKTKANNAITTVSGFANFLLKTWDTVAEKEQDGIQKNAFIKQARAFLEKAQGETKAVPVDETSMSGAAGAYLTPYAFRIPKKKKKKKVTELDKQEKSSLKKISSQLKKSVKSHGKQAKTIDKIVKEAKEEKMYTLFSTNIEYDNGRKGYMYHLVDSETEEENEIGFDQLYFVGPGNASDPQVFAGKDFKDFDQGSYQEEEVSAEEAMKIYKGILNLNEAEYRGVEFEDYIDELEKTMYVERRDRGRFIIHPLDKPDVRRPSRDYIVIDGNNVTAVQGYNSGPISVLADRYGLDDEDDRMTDMGKTNASGRVSLLSSNILKDAIKAIEDSRDAEAKAQSDYYRERGPVSGVGNMDEGALGDGATLGPGPKAGPDGVTDSAYTKQFKYKLVKKNKDGTYVQPPSTLPVRKLWGE